MVVQLFSGGTIDVSMKQLNTHAAYMLLSLLGPVNLERGPHYPYLMTYAVQIWYHK